MRTARLSLVIAGLLLSSSLVAQERVRVVGASKAAAPSPFVSPGVDAGDYVYVSGHGPRRPDGTVPATFPEQVQQALDNIKAIVEAAELTMDHVVYAQVYLTDVSKYDELNKICARCWE